MLKVTNTNTKPLKADHLECSTTLIEKPSSLLNFPSCQSTLFTFRRNVRRVKQIEESLYARTYKEVLSKHEP